MVMVMDKQGLRGELKGWVIDRGVEEISKERGYEVKEKVMKKGGKQRDLEVKLKGKEKGKEIREGDRIDWINGVRDDEMKGMWGGEGSKYGGVVEKEEGIVGKWWDCDRQGKGKRKVRREVEEGEQVRKYMWQVVKCDEGFEGKSVGFK